MENLFQIIMHSPKGECCWTRQNLYSCNASSYSGVLPNSSHPSRREPSPIKVAKDRNRTLRGGLQSVTPTQKTKNWLWNQVSQCLGPPRWHSSKASACNAGDTETLVRSLGREDSLEEELATHSSILAWEILWTEEPGGLQSMRSQRVGYDWVCVHICAHTYTHTHLSMFTLPRVNLYWDLSASELSFP